ncbi:MAG: CBS domain-containing protein [Candidatus Bathyarchaeia archaeon]|jgi:CBS domain-containing protein
MSSVLANITVAEVMSIVVYSISPEKTVAEAYGLLRGKHLGGLPVLENGNLVGIITHNDAKGVDFNKRLKTKVKDIMTKKVVTVLPDEKVSTALEKMTKLRIMRVPVVSSTGALVGFLALSDIERAVKTLRNRKLDAPQAIKCPICGGSLAVTISRTVTCEHCGHVLSV